MRGGRLEPTWALTQEGVGVGGASIAAMLKGIGCKDIFREVENVYRALVALIKRP